MDGMGILGAFAVAEMADSGLLVTSDDYLWPAWAGCSWTKFSAAGDSLWSRSYRVSDFEETGLIWPFDIEPLADGGYVIAARYQRSSPQLDQGLLIRLDSTGSSLWSRLYSWPGHALGFRSVCESLDRSLFLYRRLGPARRFARPVGQDLAGGRQPVDAGLGP